MSYWQRCERGHVTVYNPDFPVCPKRRVYPHEQGAAGVPYLVHHDGNACRAKLMMLPDQDAVQAAFMLGGLEAVYALVRERWPVG